MTELREVSITRNSNKLFITRCSQAVNTVPKTIASDITAGDYTITMTSGHGLSANDIIGVFADGTYPRAYFGKILNVATDILTMDTPVDKSYETGESLIFEVIQNMNVDGSSIPQIFNIKNSSEHEFDVARMIIHILDNVAMDDNKFGGITALTNGVVLRINHGDGTYTNLFNIKSNGEIGELAYDKTYDDKAPAGFYGMSSRLTFTKMGAFIKLADGESIEVIIQDNLTALERFHITFEGSFRNLEE